MVWEKSNFDIGQFGGETCICQRTVLPKKNKGLQTEGEKGVRQPAQKRAVLKGPLIQAAEMPHRKFSISFTRSPT